MREIKLRAWDKKNKRFWYVVLNPTQIQWASPKYAEQTLIRELDGDVAGVSFGNNIEGFQQYTGLKDKNGVEIYEGDILHSNFTDTNRLVIWDEDGFCFRFNTGAILPKGINWEVIGNIYENKELIK